MNNPFSSHYSDSPSFKATSPKVSYRQSHKSRSQSRSTSTSNSLTTPVSIENFILNVNLDNTLPTDYFKQDILSTIKSLKIPKWRKIDKAHYKLINIDRISGAMTNSVYKLTYKNHYPLLLRLYGVVENIIDRNTELLTLIRLSKKNIGPKLLGCFNNGRFEEFLNNSVTLNKFQLRDAKISRMIARRMKEFHYGVELTYEEFHNGPKSWLLIEKWIALVDNFIKNSNSNQSHELNLFILNWTEFKNLVSTYKNWLYSIYGNSDNLKEKLKFCHNDTQYGNLLFYRKSDALPMNDDDDDDNTTKTDKFIDDNEISNLSLNSSSAHHDDVSTATTITAPLPIITDTNFIYDTRLTVIDFEYAGANLPAYDIANQFCEWMYDYHDELESYKTHESKYPSVEERINFLNSYIKYVPGSTTPHFNPMNLSSTAQPPLKQSPSVVSIKLNKLPLSVKILYNETIYWRSTSSILWALWAIVSKGSIIPNEETAVQDFENTKFESGPNGEIYQIIESNDKDEVASNVSDDSDDSQSDFLKPTLDDEFDHLKYALGKVGVFIGDMIQFGLLDKNSIIQDNLQHVKYLDTELLPVTIA